MGAWIETLSIIFNTSNVLAAPFMGAWIETNGLYGDSTTIQPLLHLWEHGLKHQDGQE